MESKITPEIENKIIELLKAGKNVIEIAKHLGITPLMISRHRERYPLFADIFTSARIEGVEALVDELQYVPDNYSDPQKGRLKVDVLKFIIQHRDPTNWSDKIQIDVSSTIDIRSALDEAKNRIRDIIQIPSVQLVESIAGNSSGAAGYQPAITDNPEENEATILKLDDLLK